MAEACFVCYNFKAGEGKIVFLECLHSLCENCLSKLQVNCCPFCRTEIKAEINLPITQEIKHENLVNVHPQLSRVRFRNRSGARNGFEIIDTAGGPIIEEFRLKKKRTRS